MLHFLVLYPRLLGFPLFVTQILGDKRQCDNKLNYCYMSEIMTKTVVHLRFFGADSFCFRPLSIDDILFTCSALLIFLKSCFKLEISPQCHFPCKNFSAFVSISYETSRLGRPKWLVSSDRKPFILFCSIASKLIARDKYIQKSLVHLCT